MEEKTKKTYNLSARVDSGKWANMHVTFRQYFPTLSDRIVRWGRFDQASIFLIDGQRREYIFSYHNDRDWSLQTKTNYLNYTGKKVKEK